MRCFPAILVCCWALSAFSAEQRLINGVAVIVNDAIITYQEVEMFVRQATESLERRYGDQPQLLQQRKSEVRADGTEQLVERQLILHDFKTAGYNLPESYIDDIIKERIRQKYGDRATLAKTLKEEGVTFETYRRSTREEIIVEILRSKHVQQEVLISPQKILDYYEARKTNYAVGEQVKLRMIVLNKRPNDNGATRKLADEILGRIESGVAFEEMAKIHSEQGSTRTAGGEWGWADRDSLRTELAEIAFKLEKGQRSKVIELPEACFLMLVEDKRVAHLKPLSDVRDDIERELLREERRRLERQWIDRLRKKSFVRYF